MYLRHAFWCYPLLVTSDNFYLIFIFFFKKIAGDLIYFIVFDRFYSKKYSFIHYDNQILLQFIKILMLILFTFKVDTIHDVC